MDGILALWKEPGMTSFDCVAQVRKLYATKKVGHTGTLDPQVDGVLPICIGQATKFVEEITASHKAYSGRITLGTATETEDQYGATIAQARVPKLDTAQVDQAMQAFLGPIQQIPPMYSAVKVNGKRLYEYARQGQVIERPARQVEIFTFERTSDLTYQEDQGLLSWDFTVTCSKGTYIRTLAVDLGKNLGYPAHMSQLTRIKSGPFIASDCLRLSQLEAMSLEERHAQLMSLDELLEKLQYPRLEIEDHLLGLVKNGAVLSQDQVPIGQKSSILLHQGQALAIYGPHPHKAGMVKPVKMLGGLH